MKNIDEFLSFTCQVKIVVIFVTLMTITNQYWAVLKLQLAGQNVSDDSSSSVDNVGLLSRDRWVSRDSQVAVDPLLILIFFLSPEAQAACSSVTVTLSKVDLLDLRANLAEVDMLGIPWMALIILNSTIESLKLFFIRLHEYRTKREGAGAELPGVESDSFNENISPFKVGPSATSFTKYKTGWS